MKMSKDNKQPSEAMQRDWSMHEIKETRYQELLEKEQRLEAIESEALNPYIDKAVELKLQQRLEAIESADYTKAMNGREWLYTTLLGLLHNNQITQCTYNQWVLKGIIPMQDYVEKVKSEFEQQAKEFANYKEMVFCIRELLGYVPKDIRDIATFTWKELNEIFNGGNDE